MLLSNFNLHGHTIRKTKTGKMYKFERFLLAGLSKGLSFDGKAQYDSKFTVSGN